MSTGSFPGVKSGRGLTLTPHPLPVPWSRKGRAIFFSPYEPYGLYRASVPVPGVHFTFICQNETVKAHSDDYYFWDMTSYNLVHSTKLALQMEAARFSDPLVAVY